MVVSSKSKAKDGRKQHVRTLGQMVVISPSAAKDALPPRAVVADEGSAGEKIEYILRRARVVPQRVRGRRLSFTFFLPLLFMMLRSLDLLSLCQGDGSCLFHSLQHGLMPAPCAAIHPTSSGHIVVLQYRSSPSVRVLAAFSLLLWLFQPGDDCGARNLD